MVIQIFRPVTFMLQKIIYSYHNLHTLIQDKEIVVVKSDKDSSIVIMKNSDS